jgi:3-methyl-2-oxobutanoate hydroxymethyltransferase
MPRITSLDLLRMKADREPIAMVTAYDFTMAKIVDSAGVDMVLVGDSLGMVFQGHQDTLSVTTEQMIYHGACVSRGLKRAHLTIDMPFMSYQVSPSQALETAGRLVKEGHAQSVKLEGGERSAAAISAIVGAGIPVVAHIGLTPQSVNALGGFKVQGIGDKAADQLLRDAQAVEAAGAFCVVLEMVPTEIAAIITDAIGIPTIGIGAGVDCDGQVLVCNDLLGFDSSFKPKFVKRYAKLEAPMTEAVAEYVKEVRGKEFPTKGHTFHKRRGPSKVAKIY